MSRPVKSVLLGGLTLGLLLAVSLPALATVGADGVFIPWQDKLGNFFTNPIVATVLLVIGIAGIVIEIATVGSFGAFGVVGVLAFAAYFIGSAWNGSLTYVALILLAAGVVLLMAEIFFVPGFGLPGGLGIFCILAALVLASPTPLAALWELLLAVALSGVIVWRSLKNRKTRAFWQRLTLKVKSDSASGYTAPDASWQRFLGRQGLALTVLRPAGTALINGEKADVVTSGEFIPAGARIEVILVEGVRIVVKELPPSEE